LYSKGLYCGHCKDKVRCLQNNTQVKELVHVTQQQTNFLLVCMLNKWKVNYKMDTIELELDSIVSTCTICDEATSNLVQHMTSTHHEISDLFRRIMKVRSS
jgi:hypothetical protein